MSHHQRRRKYATDPDVLQAADDSWAASKTTWVDPDNPTPEEECAAQDARLAAMVAEAQSKVDAE